MTDVTEVYYSSSAAFAGNPAAIAFGSPSHIHSRDPTCPRYGAAALDRAQYKKSKAAKYSGQEQPAWAKEGQAFADKNHLFVHWDLANESARKPWGEKVR